MARIVKDDRDELHKSHTSFRSTQDTPIKIPKLEMSQSRDKTGVCDVPSISLPVFHQIALNDLFPTKLE